MGTTGFATNMAYSVILPSIASCHDFLKLQTVHFVSYFIRRRHRSLILRTDDLMLLPGAMNEVNPALNISDETIESLVSTFVRLREVLLSTSFLSSFHLPHLFASLHH